MVGECVGVRDEVDVIFFEDVVGEDVEFGFVGCDDVWIVGVDEVCVGFR